MSQLLRSPFNKMHNMTTTCPKNPGTALIIYQSLDVLEKMGRLTTKYIPLLDACRYLPTYKC